MPLANKKLLKTRFEDFPLRLFFRLLRNDDRAANLFLGEGRWQAMRDKWEESANSLEDDRMLEDQKKVVLPLIKAQKATLVLRWAQFTSMDIKPVFEELGLPWEDDPIALVERLDKYIKKNLSQYENNLIQLEATKKQAEDRSQHTDFSIDDAIATLNLAGFTITDRDTLTIGEFRSMTKTMERNGRRKD